MPNHRDDTADGKFYELKIARDENNKYLSLQRWGSLKSKVTNTAAQLRKPVDT